MGRVRLNAKLMGFEESTLVHYRLIREMEVEE